MVCRERARHITVGTPMTDRNASAAAIMGTFIHKGLEKSRGELHSHLLHEVAIEIELPNGAVMVGHADEVDPVENSVLQILLQCQQNKCRPARDRAYAYFQG